MRRHSKTRYCLDGGVKEVPEESLKPSELVWRHRRSVLCPFPRSEKRRSEKRCGPAFIAN